MDSLADPIPTRWGVRALTPALSGAGGSPTASATRIAAADDLGPRHRPRLARYADSAATLASYRREAERAAAVGRAAVGQATVLADARGGLLAYERFLADPQPARP